MNVLWPETTKIQQLVILSTKSSGKNFLHLKKQLFSKSLMNICVHRIKKTSQSHKIPLNLQKWNALPTHWIKSNIEQSPIINARQEVYDRQQRKVKVLFPQTWVLQPCGPFFKPLLLRINLLPYKKIFNKNKNTQ